MRTASHHSAGATLIETVIVLGLIGLVAGITIPPAARLLDGIRLRSATSEVVSLFATARNIAILHSTHATVKVDEKAGVVALYTPRDTLHVRRLHASYGVTLDATRDSVSYGPTGMGYGAANTRIIITLGARADTITTSRLGRVRH
jgi:type II secretory pathway pseudopilin PulG